MSEEPENINQQRHNTLHIDLTFDGSKMRKQIDHLLEREVQKLATEMLSTNIPTLLGHLEWAWALIANAHGGNWQSASRSWRDGAALWRDRYHDILAELAVENGEEDLTFEKMAEFSALGVEPREEVEPLTFPGHSASAKTIDKVSVNLNEKTGLFELVEEEE